MFEALKIHIEVGIESQEIIVKKYTKVEEVGPQKSSYDIKQAPITFGEHLGIIRHVPVHFAYPGCRSCRPSSTIT